MAFRLPFPQRAGRDAVAEFLREAGVLSGRRGSVVFLRNRRKEFRAAQMLFNSFDFIFLPVTLAAFAAAVRLRSSSGAVLVLLVASYVFYGYGDHFAVLLLAGSTAFN